MACRAISSAVFHEHAYVFFYLTLLYSTKTRGINRRRFLHMLRRCYLSLFSFFLRNKLLHASQQNVGWLTIPIHVLPHTKIGSNYALNPCYLTVYRDDIKEIGAMLCCVRFKVTKCSYFIVHDVL